MDIPAIIESIKSDLGRVVVGQDRALNDVLVGFFASGHVLLEGVPGVGKTLLARALTRSLGLDGGRIQFTPDLMPADLIGTRVFDAETRTWEVHRGPVFCDVLLADEINRTPPKTQSALLEAMAERQVTLDGEHHGLGTDFFVIATENPLEFEGTYPLPEAQTDRFLLRVVMGYPDEEAELSLLTGAPGKSEASVAGLQPRLTRAELAAVKAQVAAVRVDEAVGRYVLGILRASRKSEALRVGASPRAGLMLTAAARARAAFAGRDFVIPEDIKAMCAPVLSHRVSLSPEAELDGETPEGALRSLVEAAAVRTVVDNDDAARSA